MNTKQLWQSLTNNCRTVNYFNGVYSYNNLGEITKRPKLIICNTDPSYRSGEHWVLFLFNNDNSVDFFDSMGKEPGFYGLEFTNLIEKYSNYFYMIDYQIQPIDSNLCGFYCLSYAYLKCVNLSFKKSLIPFDIGISLITSSIRLSIFTHFKYAYDKQ